LGSRRREGGIGLQKEGGGGIGKKRAGKMVRSKKE